MGYIVGLNVAILIAAGGLFSWWLAIPLYNSFFFDHDPVLLHKLVGLDAEDAAFAIWRAQVRYIGVGCMLTGALWALWSLAQVPVDGRQSGLKASGKRGREHPAHRTRSAHGRGAVGIALFVIPLFVLYYLVVGTLGVALAMAVIMIIAGFLFSSVSGYMAGLVGSSNNPVSGITICTILFASLVLMWMVGGKSAIGAVAVVFIGAVVCNAAAVAGDNLQDLKAGQLIGATPWRQQVMLGVGVIASAAVMAPVMNVLLFAYGIGEPAHAGVKALPAPQANLVKSVAEGMFGGTLPVVHDCHRRCHRRADHPPGLVSEAPRLALERARYWRWRWAFICRWMFPRPCWPAASSRKWLPAGIASRHEADDHEKLAQNGMLFAAGLITGEALVGIFIAMCIWISKNPGVLALGVSLPGAQWIAAVTAVGRVLLDFPRRHPAPRRVDCATRRQSTDLILCLGTVYLVWGSAFLFTKIAVENLPAALFAGIRFVTAGILLTLIACLVSGARLPARRQRMASCHRRGLFHGVCQQWIEYLGHAIHPEQSIGFAQRHLGLLDRRIGRIRPARPSADAMGDRGSGHRIRGRRIDAAAARDT